MSSRLVHRAMTRCKVCRAWWSSTITGYVAELASTAGDESEGVPVLADRCACGGDLELADMDAHKAALPYVPFTVDVKKG